MKKIMSVSSLVLLFLFNCSDTKESLPSNQTSLFSRHVGKQISMTTAERWINRYKQNNGSFKTNTSPIVTEEILRVLVNPITESLGISFHRAIDQNGNYHILVVPVKEGQSIWDAVNVLDANEGLFINPQTARSWAMKYKDENPNEIWSHFFGAELFEYPFVTIELIEALNDKNETQLLLYITKNQSSTSGRENSEKVEIYDASYPCPTICHE